LRGSVDGLSSVRTVVVGDEGRGSAKWRRAYMLNGHGPAGWQLPDDVLKRGSGWYFVRLYDATNELIDSLDFRYVPRLRAINASMPQLKKSTDELPVSIEFVHESGVTIARLGSPADSIASILGVQRNEDFYQTTRFEWPLNPDTREATFEIEDAGKPVFVTFETDRIWWSEFFSSQPDAGRQWLSSSIELPVEAFAPESNTEVRFRFPRSSTIQASVGFDHALRRDIGRADAEGIVGLRLHEFCEAQELTDLGTHALSLWICEGDQEIQLDVAKVTIAKTCRWCDFRTACSKDCVDHVVHEHHDELFNRLELREDEIIGSTLPQAVFICMECGLAYPRDLRPERNATSLILRHFNVAHPNTHPHFKRVDRPETLRNLFAQRQKVIWKCKLGDCDPIVPPSGDEYAVFEKQTHLKEEHFDQLFRGGF
jgi:hypothetical protein